MYSFLHNFARSSLRIYGLTSSINYSSIKFRKLSTESPAPQNLVFDNVNKVISDNLGQTFAVIHLYNKQYLIHIGDIIGIDYAIQADIGEKIKLEKCLLVGNENFTLIGRPVLNRDLVQVEATVIEKTMSQTYMNMFHIPRNHGFKKYLFSRQPLSMLRINEIKVCHRLNENQHQIN